MPDIRGVAELVPHGTGCPFNDAYESSKPQWRQMYHCECEGYRQLTAARMYADGLERVVLAALPDPEEPEEIEEIEEIEIHDDNGERNGVVIAVETPQSFTQPDSSPELSEE